MPLHQSEWALFTSFNFVFRLNILAELLCFGDREFYKDWWNAKTIDEVDSNITLTFWLYLNCFRAGWSFLFILLRDYPAAAAVISTGGCGIWYAYLPFFLNHCLILMHANMWLSCWPRSRIPKVHFRMMLYPVVILGLFCHSVQLFLTEANVCLLLHSTLALAKDLSTCD